MFYCSEDHTFAHPIACSFSIVSRKLKKKSNNDISIETSSASSQNKQYDSLDCLPDNNCWSDSYLASCDAFSHSVIEGLLNPFPTERALPGCKRVAAIPSESDWLEMQPIKKKWVESKKDFSNSILIKIKNCSKIGNKYVLNYKNQQEKNSSQIEHRSFSIRSGKLFRNGLL